MANKFPHQSGSIGWLSPNGGAVGRDAATVTQPVRAQGFEPEQGALERARSLKAAARLLGYQACRALRLAACSALFLPAYLAFFVVSAPFALAALAMKRREHHGEGL